MAEEIKRLYQEFCEGKISRREFMRQAILLTGSLAAANSFIESLAPAGAHAAVVAPDDPAILTHNVQFKGKTTSISGYLARPVKAGKYPAVVVNHENLGLSPHIEDVARRFAKAGFVALAPDYLSRMGGTKLVNPKMQGLSNIREIAPWQNVAEDTGAAFAYLNILPDVRGDQRALVGFCVGGEWAFAAATQVPTLRAVVVYYGTSPNPLDLVKNIRAPIMAHYAEKDPGVNKGIPDTVAAMKKYNKTFDHKIYAGAQHAFNNDDRKDRYDATASKEAWERTMDFLRKNLKS
jgi:carboxymethylenebutenolidase